jgi:hypothetical protein
MAKHHNQCGVAFNKRAFHEGVLDKIRKILIHVQAHIHWSQSDAERGFDFGGANNNILVNGYTAVFASKAVNADNITVLVFTICRPRNCRRGAFGDDFNNVTCTNTKLLHSALINTGDSASDVTLSCVSCT